MGTSSWNWDAVPNGRGILAIRNRETSKSYFVGVSDLRQRAYDHHRLLVAGNHHNAALQVDWQTDPSQFEIVAIEQVHCKTMLPIFKQVWIERTLECYNRKNAVPKKSHS